MATTEGFVTTGCPTCEARFKVPPKAVGSSRECVHCGERFAVVAPTPPASHRPPSASVPRPPDLPPAAAPDDPWSRLESAATVFCLAGTAVCVLSYVLLPVAAAFSLAGGLPEVVAVVCVAALPQAVLTHIGLTLLDRGAAVFSRLGRDSHRTRELLEAQARPS